MPVSVGTAYVDIRPDLSGFGRELNSGVDRASSDAGEKAGSGMAGGFKKVGGMLAGAFAGVQVAGFLKDAVGAASDLGESASKVGVVFGDQAGAIQKFASDAATNLGMSKQAALEATGTLGNLFSAMGMGKKETADLSTGMVGLASDLASFNNASPEDTLLALRSGLLGEAEPLKRFGVNLNAARIEAEALAMGLVKPAVNAEKIAAARLKVEQATKGVLDAEKAFGKESAQAVEARAKQAGAEEALTKAMEGTKVELTAAQKAQAAHSVIMKDTTLAQGDFARTSDGLANKQRILGAQFEDVKAKIGTALMPAVLKVATFLSENLGPAFDGIKVVAGHVGEAFKWVGGLFKSEGGGMGGEANKLSAIFEQFKTHFVTIFETVKAVVATAVAVVTDLWDRFGKTILSFLRETWEGVLSVIRGVMNTLTGIFELVKAILTGKWGEAWAAVKKIFDGIWDTLWAVIKNVFTNILPTIFDIAKGLLSAGWSLLWNSLGTLFSALWGGIWAVILAAFEGIVTWFSELPGKLATAVGDLFGFIKDKLVAGWDATVLFFDEVQAWLTELPGKMAGWVGDMFSWIKDKVVAGWNATVLFFDEVERWLRELPGKMAGWAGNLFGWIWDKIVAGWNAAVLFGDEIEKWLMKLPGKLAGWAGDIFAFLKDKLVAGWNAAVGFFDTIETWIKELPGKISGWATGAFDGIKDGFRSAVNAIIGFWNRTVGSLRFEIPGWVPGVGGKGFDMPKIPELAAGGNVLRGGAALVGERGAELLELPRGARVSPLERDLELEPAGRSGPVIGEFNLNGSDLSAWDVADEIGWLMRTTGR